MAQRTDRISRVVADLRRERDALRKQADQIDAAIEALRRAGTAKATRKKAKRKLSAKGRAAISRAAKKRWAEYHRQQKKRGG